MFELEFDIVRGNDRNGNASAALIDGLKSINDIEGTLYLGYPLLAQDEISITIDALYVSRKYGMIAFSYEQNDYKDNQDQIYYNLDFSLKKYSSLRAGRELAFNPIVITFQMDESISDDENYIVANKDYLATVLSKYGKEIDREIYTRLIESLQKISSMKPKKKRDNVQFEDSLGGKIKTIEKEIANLDYWQKKAAYETPEGVQRIRGLAGSGKTVVLALKAAYLHSQYPKWDIGITFYSRSLAQQFRTMVNSFYREYADADFDETKLHILHAWGSDVDDGIYACVCRELNLLPLNYNAASSRFGREDAFSGAINEALYSLGENELKMFDALLIDEAQDMPANFFKLCYKIVKNPKRITYAYDELQNLSDSQMPTLKEMFGEDNFGNALVDLTSSEDQPKKDIVLPVCYRNTSWALSVAHALGFGIYRDEGLVQYFNQHQLWTEIGYDIHSGDLVEGKKVTLKRSDKSSPQYFKELIKPNEAVYNHPSFLSKMEQYEWIANDIESSLSNELDPDDILVIFPNVMTAKKEYMQLRRFLEAKGINSSLAGFTTERDIFYVKGEIMCSQIYRAKGNEAPLVYVVNADYCATGDGLALSRNILFTAITRSRAWVKITGVGPMMDIINKEIDACISNDYSLTYTVPSAIEIEQIRKVHRELSTEEKAAKKKINEAIVQLQELVEIVDIDESIINKIRKIIGDNND